MKRYTDYTATAVEQPRTAVSKHGIRTTQGGRVLEVRHFRYPHDPYQIAEAIMKADYPGAKIILKAE